MLNNIKAHQFYKSYIKKIYIDPAFQRRACWSQSQCRKFILSLNKGRVLSPICVADVETGMLASKSDPVSEEKYKKVKGVLNKTMVSLDGQNRTKAIADLFDNKLQLTGTFTDADNKSVGISNKLYKDLPYRLQDALKDAKVELKRPQLQNLSICGLQFKVLKKKKFNALKMLNGTYAHI